jgi:single-stranded DNA-binding protein
LNTNYLENNHLVLVGKVTSDKKFSHEIYGEKFYIFDLEVPRLSGNADIIPITISERLLEKEDLEIDKKIIVEGQFRSYNSYQNERNKLVLTVFAKDVKFIENQDEEIQASKDFVSNEVTLNGYICKKPIYRQTPFGREIADLLLAVNRAYNKSDYIPCIAWGRNARFCENIEVGTEVKVVGRVQSRTYEKKYEDGTSETKVAYEVSISSLEIVKQDDDENKNDMVNEEEQKEAM